jgi:hypothetical protein
VDDPRVLNDISWVLQSSAPWRDLPERYGPRPNHSIQQAVDPHECRKRAVIERVYSPSLFASLQDSAFERSVGVHSVGLGESIERLGMNPMSDSCTCKRAHSHYRSQPMIAQPTIANCHPYGRSGSYLPRLNLCIDWNLNRHRYH